MPLWSTTRSSSYNSTTSSASTSSNSGPPQLPPLPQFTPPSTSHLPHFEKTPKQLSKLSINSHSSKGKQQQQQGDDDEDDEDDPWRDGSEDEETIKNKHSTSPSSSSRSRGVKTTTTTSPTTTTATATGTGGGGGWFSSFTSPFSNSSTSPTTTTTTISTSTSISNSKGVLKRSSHSYLGKVNQVQKEADQIVQQQEQQQQTTTKSSTTNSSINQEQDDEKEEGQNGRNLGSSEKERLKKHIRKDIFDLVKDPTNVLPRLRKEWLSKPTPTATSTSSSTTSTTTTRKPQNSTSRNNTRNSNEEESRTPTTRLSISSDLSTVASEEEEEEVAEEEEEEEEEEEDEEGKPRGYFALNASSISSSTVKPVVDYNQGGGLQDAGGELGREIRRKKKFLDVLQGITSSSNEEEEEEEEEAEGIKDGETDLTELRKLSWGGIPKDLRVVVWMLLLGYLPSPFVRRETTLARKRQEYRDAVKLAFSRGVKGLDGPIWHQISIDVPRTRPGVKIWMRESTQRSLERILYVWAIRHPASGYVQGINDLVTPFFQVYLSLYIDSDPEEFDPSLLPVEALEALEADSFWCLSKLLDGIQDNYIFAQPGITRAVKKMELLCKRVDAPLAKHLQSEGVEFIQFAFRWMNCLLMRELSVENIVRMWDTYLAEGGEAFSEFHLYVCLSFLVKWSEQLRTMDFQSIIIFLQSLPTKDWKDSNTELLLSEAFMWSRTFEAR
ncbi:hypothetical protein JCM3765_006995 [Sporobolomyces pararoseus]